MFKEISLKKKKRFFEKKYTKIKETKEPIWNDIKYFLNLSIGINEISTAKK